MTKIVLSLVLSIVLAGGTAAGLVLAGRSREPCRSCTNLEGDLAAVGEELQSLREDTRSLLEEMRRRPLETRQEPRVAPTPVAARGAEGEAGEIIAAVRPDELTQYVLSALVEDRKQQEAERQERREEERARQETRRQEQEALKEGPYDRYNLKVNSLAKVLELNNSQSQAYHALLTESRDKLKQIRNLAQETPAVSTETTPQGEEKGRSRGREQWQKLREVTESVQKEFAERVQMIFSPVQLETYNQLSDSARSFLGVGSVSGGERGEGEAFGGRGGFGPRGRGGR